MIGVLGSGGTLPLKGPLRELPAECFAIRRAFLPNPMPVRISQWRGPVSDLAAVDPRIAVVEGGQQFRIHRNMRERSFPSTGSRRLRRRNDPSFLHPGTTSIPRCLPLMGNRRPSRQYASARRAMPPSREGDRRRKRDRSAAENGSGDRGRCAAPGGATRCGPALIDGQANTTLVRIHPKMDGTSGAELNSSKSSRALSTDEQL